MGLGGYQAAGLGFAERVVHFLILLWGSKAGAALGCNVHAWPLFTSPGIFMLKRHEGNKLVHCVVVLPKAS